MLTKRHIIKCDIKTCGFTIIELIVVIAIISILVSIIVPSLNNVRSKARNARERTELRQIIIALELAKSNSATNKYPLSASNGADWSCLKPSGICFRNGYSALPAQGIADLAPYLPTIPLTAVEATGCYMYDSYLYISNFPSSIGGYGGPGAWIIWAKERTAGSMEFSPGECAGYQAGIYDCNLQYCYQYIGLN